MKQTILRLSTFLMIFSFAIQGQAQVTIAEGDFPRLATFTDSVRFTEQAGIVAPSEGAAQVWNYTSLQATQLNTIAHFDATSDANFPNALNYSESDLTFQGFYIESNKYEAIDAEGWYDMGRSITDVTYSITAISGGPDDSLRFVGSSEIYDGRIDLVKFPMTYPDQWSQAHVEQLDFELTVAAFGLDQTPGFRKRAVSQDREIVAYGELTIPKSDGSPSLPFDVLLLKMNRTEVDSFFLGGAPAPPALLAAFGLTQGSTAVDSFYVFYKPGFAAPVLNINFSATGAVSNAFYRPQSADNLVSVRNPDVPEFKSFPNPIGAGEKMFVQMDQQVPSGTVSFYDLAGRFISQVGFTSTVTNQFQVEIPSDFNKGLYLYQVRDQKGILKGTGKFLVP